MSFKDIEKEKAYHKQYREQHKEEMKAYGEQYRKQHKEEMKAHGKRHYEQHKDKIKERSKQYREQHKEKGKQYREQNHDQLMAKHYFRIIYGIPSAMVPPDLLEEKINLLRVGRKLKKLKKEIAQ